MSLPSCPACGQALDERRELGSILEPGGALEHVRFECGGCRAIVGRDFQRGRMPTGNPVVVFTGASVVRALEPLESRARSADRAGVLDELRSLQRDEEKQFLGASEAVQRAIRGIGLVLARHAALPITYRPAGKVGGRALLTLFPSTSRLRLTPVRIVDDLGLSDEVLDAGGVVLPDPGAAEGAGADVLLVLAGTRLVADGAESGLLRVRPPAPGPALSDWGSFDVLVVDLNLVSVA